MCSLEESPVNRNVSVSGMQVIRRILDSSLILRKQAWELLLGDHLSLQTTSDIKLYTLLFVLFWPMFLFNNLQF